MDDADRTCRLCSQPVRVNREQYEVFEKMHWLCFHIVFEHSGDPDEACTDPSCPWWQLDILRRRVTELGDDPARAIRQAIDEKVGLISKP